MYFPLCLYILIVFSRLETLPHILRFGVHLALFLRQIGFILPETDVNYVIQGFTKILIKESKVGLHHVPGFVGADSGTIERYYCCLRKAFASQHANRSLRVVLAEYALFSHFKINLLTNIHS